MPLAVSPKPPTAIHHRLDDRSRLSTRRRRRPLQDQAVVPATRWNSRGDPARAFPGVPAGAGCCQIRGCLPAHAGWCCAGCGLRIRRPGVRIPPSAQTRTAPDGAVLRLLRDLSCTAHVRANRPPSHTVPHSFHERSTPSGRACRSDASVQSTPGPARSAPGSVPRRWRVSQTRPVPGAGATANACAGWSWASR